MIPFGTFETTSAGSGRPAPLASTLILMLFQSAVLAGCGLGFDREAMLGAVADNVIVPAHLALNEDARALDEAARAFLANPLDETLEDVQARWLETTLSWKRVELYEFPGLLLIHNAIERRPARVEFIEDAIAGADAEALGQVDATFVESLGSTSKGLGAIEYLIFPAVDQTETVLERFGDSARGAYLTALTSNLAAKTDELRRFWTPEGESYAQTFRENDSEGADIQGSVSLLANEMIELYEMVLRRKLGIPMGQTTDGVPRPDEVESSLSGASLEMMIANVESLERTFDAGLDDYVDYLDREEEEDRLSEAIRRQFGVVLSALNGIEVPLHVAVTDSKAQVDTAYREMESLLVLLKTDMAALLGITVTFSDNDGD